VPTSSDPGGPLPVVIDLHGYSEGADSHARTTGFEQLGAADGFVTITPQAEGAVPAWDLSRTGRDVVFVADALDDVESDVCIDPTRVYVAGHSMGAMLLSVLACSTFASRVAAWAPVAGLREVPACATTGEPVIVTHGTDDGTVPYEGGLSEAAAQLLLLPTDGPPIPRLTDEWAVRNGCHGVLPTQRTHGDVTVFAHPCGVVLRRIEHGSHAWAPGTTLAIWDFLRDYRS
jgi:polyhydroxybutyrate depolymerase